MKKLFPIFIVILSAASLMGQGVAEAVRYSSYEPIATARLAGVSGAFGAMGGDIGVLSINPAGIADFWKSEFTLSPAFTNVRTIAFLNADKSPLEKTDNSNFSVNNFGVVFAHQPKGTFKTSNLAISVHRTGSFRQLIEYQGFTQGSITERFLELANGKTEDQLDDFEAFPAYFTDAIYLDGNQKYRSDISPNTFITKGQTIRREGRSSEFNITWAGKTESNLNIGVGVGIPSISFEEVKAYFEVDDMAQLDTFGRIDYTEELVTSGTGINAKLGVQYQALSFIRLGASLQTPSVFFMNDSYTTGLRYQYILNESPEPYLSPEGSFNYRLRTPWKANLSLGGLFRLNEKMNAFVNADLEYIDYRINELDYRGTDSDLERDANEQIESQLSGAVNYRIGGELAFMKFRFRGGTAITASPYFDSKDNNLSYSGGLGFRGNKFFLDLAYRINQSEEGYIPYLLLDNEQNQVVTTEKRVSNLIITAGFKF